MTNLLIISSIAFLLLWICSGSNAGKVRQKSFKYGPCLKEQYRCLNDNCIKSSYLCDGQDDCGDNSDETFCDYGFYNDECPRQYSFYRCLESKCIPLVWKCDSIKNCPKGDDEKDCVDSIGGIRGVIPAKRAAMNWFFNQRKNETTTDKWGAQVARIAVALYLADSLFLKQTGQELAYELSIRFLSKLSLRKLKDISTSDLALFTNAFVVSCIDPRKFHVLDLVAELRERVDAQNYTNPYVMLALCNSGEKITGKDVEKLITAFWGAHSDVWTDTQALVIMALVCASTQPDSSFDLKDIKEFTMELKKRQAKNGTVENLKTTALVLQALFTAEIEDDEENFDEEKAIQQIIKMQLPDGSFGNIINTYFVLPVLSYRSLVNISSVHCKTSFKDEDSGFRHLANQVGLKWRIQISLWIGDHREIERTLKLRIPGNTSLYEIMEWAAEVDSQYRFEYSMKNKKPYIYAISGIQDDPENGQFWFPHILQDQVPTLITGSPVDFIPKDNSHLIMWYKCGSWIQ